jgi:hypothetical protein
MSQPTTPPNGSVPPMPHPGANPGVSSPDAAVPPMPSEVPGGRAPGAGGRFRAAMAPLRKMMRRAA